MPPTAARGGEEPGSVVEVNRGGDARLVPDDACSVSFSRQVFCQVHMPWAVTVQATISEPDLHFALQCDDELSARGGVPIAKTAGLRASKDDALRGHELGELWMGGEVQFFDVRLAIWTGIQTCNPHVSSSLDKATF